MRLLNSLFGKKIILEIPDKEGNIIRKKISKKKFEELVAEGKIKHVNTIKAHILDPNRGYYVADWEVDVDIAREDFDKFGTPNGELYVAIAYIDGKPKTMIMKKDVWEKQRSIFDSIDKGEDYQNELDEHISSLKKKINDND